MRDKIKARPADPLRKKIQIKQVAKYIRENYESGAMLRRMFLMGCNTGLRASDLRKMKVGYFTTADDYFDVTEQKTGKIRRVYKNDTMKKLFEEYMNEFRTAGGLMLDNEARLFWSAKNTMIGVKYIHYVIKDACRALEFEGNYGSHTMRKTFAYQAFQKCRDLTSVKNMLNHSDVYTTRIYLQEFESELSENKTKMDEKEISQLNLE